MKGLILMSKKKKKKNREISVLEEVDKVLNSTYEELKKEIEEFQIRINIADQEAKKKAKKAMKKKNQVYDITAIQKNVRNEIVKEIEGNNFLDRCVAFLQDMVPILTVITRLIASLILSIMSLTCVKVRIKPETYEKFKNVYDIAMKIS